MVLTSGRAALACGRGLLAAAARGVVVVVPLWLSGGLGAVVVVTSLPHGEVWLPALIVVLLWGRVAVVRLMPLLLAGGRLLGRHHLAIARGGAVDAAPFGRQKPCFRERAVRRARFCVTWSAARRCRCQFRRQRPGHPHPCRVPVSVC